MEVVPPRRAARPRERPAEDHVAGIQLLVVRRKLVGEPGDAVGRVVQHRGGEPGLFDHAVLVEHRADPAQVELGRAHRPTAGDDAGIGREIGDRVEDLAHDLGLAVELLDAGIDDFDRRRDVFGRREHVEHRHAGAFQRPAEHERQFDLDPRRDEALERDVRALLEEHVVHQRGVVGLGDLRSLLHRPRREADLAAANGATVGDFEPHPFALDGIAVLDRHRRMRLREVTQLGARLARVVQLAGETFDRDLREHRFRPS